MARKKKSERPYIVGMSRRGLPGQVHVGRDRLLRHGIPDGVRPDVRLFSMVHGPIEGNRTVDGYVIARMRFGVPDEFGRYGLRLMAFPIGDQVIEPIRR